MKITNFKYSSLNRQAMPDCEISPNRISKVIEEFEGFIWMVIGCLKAFLTFSCQRYGKSLKVQK